MFLFNMIGESQLIFTRFFNGFLIESADETNILQIQLINIQFLSQSTKGINNNTRHNIDHNDHQQNEVNVIEKESKEKIPIIVRFNICRRSQEPSQSTIRLK